MPLSLATLFIVAVTAVLIAYIIWGPKSQQAPPGPGTVVTLYSLPGCGHCKALQPTWNRLMALFPGAVGQVDCSRTKCQFKGYPTIVRSSDGAVFDGQRAFDHIARWAGLRHDK